MKRLSIALACLGLGLIASPLLQHDATSAVPANPKLGIIDIEDTLSSTPAGKRANDEFEKKRKGKQDALDKKQDELKKADADLSKQQAVLKPDVYAQKRQDLEKNFVDLQQTYVKLERELATDRTKLIQDLLKKAEPIIEKIGKAEGVSIILDRSATVWADPAVDLTPKLKAEMK
jgi:outer membrane protein